MVFVWDRSTCTGKLYLNGVYTGQQHCTGQDIDLILTNHTTYELGFKKDTKEILHGSLRDLMVFLRPLTTEEAFALCSKFCIWNCDYRGIGMKVLLALIGNGGASAHERPVSSLCLQEYTTQHMYRYGLGILVVQWNLIEEPAPPN